MQVGVVTRSFAGMTAAECAERMRAAGFTSTELCFVFSDLHCWQYNGRSDMTALTDARAKETVDIFRTAGIDVVAVGAFSNLLEPDAALLEDNMRVYARYIEIARDNGIPYVATESGFVPGRRGIQADTYEKDYQYFQTNLCRLADMAAEAGVGIAFEPCLLDLTPSAKRTRDFLAQCGRDNLKILMDPANLIANSDEDDMFRYLASDVAYFHGKDRKVNDTYGRNVGDGDIDWVRFLTLYRAQTPDVPFILEYCNADNCAEIRERVLRYAQQAE